jgi:transposase
MLQACFIGPSCVDDATTLEGKRTHAQRPSPPAQRQDHVAHKTEFVICDETIERSFAWIGRNRRMSKDYEFLPATSEAWIYLSMIRLMLKRLAHEQVQPAFHYRRVA